MRQLPFIIFVLILSAGPAFCQNKPNGVTTPAAATPKASSKLIPAISRYYQREYTLQKPVQDTAQITFAANIQDIAISTQYTDVLGRPLQTVVKQGSAGGKDLVVPSYFDEFGNTPVGYMPYGDTGTYGIYKAQMYKADSGFYKTMFPNEQIYYSQQFFDGSPLNMPVKQLAPGNSWGGAGVGVGAAVRANKVGDSVRLWNINISSEDDVPATTALCDAGSLLVREITDERGVKAVSYTNELGQTVLTKTQLAASPGSGHAGWLCTYYVYDEGGHLRTVIPPKAVEGLNNATVNWNFANAATLNTNLCYAYWYDARGRVLMKRIPGKGKVYYAYDLLDRLVLTQDANLRTTSQWAFVGYDGQSRASKGGVITLTGQTATQVQTAAAGSASYPALTGTYTVFAETYYDDYSWFIAGTTPDGNLITTNITAANFNTTYNTSPDYAQPLTQSMRVRGAATGTKTLVPGTGTYLYNSLIYDDNGRVIQTKQTNLTGNKDIATVQYGFTGRVLRSHLQHGINGAAPQSHSLLTKYAYDAAGRLLTVKKNIDNQGDKTTATNTYNELGQLNTKTLGSAVETQSFSYNIRGWLTGINKGFVETVNATSFFGEELFYDYGFGSTQLNGNIAGTKWRSTGDDIQRAYGYGYDNANRLLTADFTQQNSGSTAWTSDKMDFSVSNLSYDAGGNILTMKQRGVNINQPATIDSLTYTLFANSNQLQKIRDGIADLSPWGDFKDTSATADDYVYDNNGNLTQDLNKHIHTGGIVYNVLDKATTMSVNGKGSLAYVYDAGGVLLQKTVTDTRTGMKKVITYVAGFVYCKTLPQADNAATVPDTLQYALHEEGRIRWVARKNAFFYDYFLKDHLSNVRSTVTEEKDTAAYVATMEDADSTVVKALFANVYDPVRTVSPKPPGFDNVSGNQKVAKLNGSTSANKPNGPSLLLKVMAGDKLSVSTFGFYNTPVQPTQNVDYLTPLLQLMSGGAIGNSGGKMLMSQQSAVSSTIGANIPSFFMGRPYDNTKPKAYLNWVLLDEQLNTVSFNSGAQQVPPGSSKQAMSSGTLTMAKSGYLYVWVSNESAMDVYFDDLSIVHYKGALLGEEGYYPFGLAMNALKSQAATVTPNAYKYNSGTELTEDLDVDLYETFMRQYDAQVGRFWGVDAMSEESSGLSPYHYGANDPVYHNDPTGMLTQAEWNNILSILWDSPNGGSWKSGEGDGGGGGGVEYGGGNLRTFDTPEETFYAGANYIELNGGWGQNGAVGSFEQAAASYKKTFGYEPLRPIIVKAHNVRDSYGHPWLIYNQVEVDRQLARNGFIIDEKGSAVGAWSASAVAASGDGFVPGLNYLAAAAIVSAAIYDQINRQYVTYVLHNPNGQVYVGRTSGFHDPEVLMWNRYWRNPLRISQGFTKPTLDESAQGPIGKDAIRGREQQLIDYFGGIGDPKVGNYIRGVGKWNPEGYGYWLESNALFGNIAPFTGF